MRIEIVPRSGGKRAPLAVRLLALAFLGALLVLTFACIWAGRAYENISFAEILFYLSMPLRGTAKQFSHDIIKSVFLPAGVLFLLAAALMLLPAGKEMRLRMGRRSMRLLPFAPPMKIALPVLTAWLLCLLPAADRLLDIRGYVSGLLRQSSFIEEHYADPKKTEITFPQKKRNLITLYIESAESTNQDVAHGGRMDMNYTPELTRLMEENVSFSQSGLFEGAAVAPACGWTVAGMVAQTGGVPLKLFAYSVEAADNMGSELVRFLPGAWMLGDVLKREGYRNAFICGSDFDFGGRRQLYAQHGAYEIYDYFTAVERGWIPEGYVYGWGFEDRKLYEFAKELLLELAAGDEPFHLGILTQDTHDPGWLCELCPQNTDHILGRTIMCSSRQAYDFVEWVKRQDFYENTAIVITGDHASMTRSFYEEHAGEYDKHHGGSKDRLVYNAFINPSVQPVQEKNRVFTTLDFYPTTLAAVGAKISGERLGLGTNLFSDARTLCEEFGLETVCEELNRKSLFYDKEILYP